MFRKLLISTLLFAAITTATQAIEIGEEAPALTIAKWLNGDATGPGKPDDKTIYVVEFWATWCGPCKQSIPHLNKLQTKLNEKNVVVIGISTEGEDKVAPFMKDNPMTYHVALDKENITTKAYRGEAGGIPHAYVVNKAGIVVWSGHPMNGLDEVLDKVLAGTYSLEEAKKEAMLDAKREAVIKDLQAAGQKGDFDAVLSCCDRLLAIDKTDLRALNYKVQIMKRLNKPAAEVSVVYKSWATTFADNPSALLQLAQMLVEEQGELQDLDLAEQVAETAAKLISDMKSTK
ncbi:hypothetical protein BVY04_03010 [bacterium M21]|nr:hypothetical protein BVY04_03010 [bacterium M21]